MFPRSLRGIFLTTSGLIVCSLAMSSVLVLYEVRQVEKASLLSIQAEEAAKEILRSKFYTVQIQQFYTDASLVHDEDGVKEAKTNLESLSQSISRIEDLTPEMKTELEEIKGLASSLSQVGEEMFHAYTENGKQAGDAIMKRKDTGLDDRSEKLADSLDKHVTTLTQNAKIRSEQVNQSLADTRLLALIFSGLSIVLTFISLGVLLKRIRALQQVSEVLVENTNAVSGVIADVFSVAQQLQGISATQAESVHETAASIEEISTMAARSSENAKQSESSSQQAQSIASQGQNIVLEMVNAVKNIQNGNDEIEKTVTQGNQRFKEILGVIEEIGTKTQVINDIVFQTKLLSFNASVEAARAGEHGKGFAVVAEEIGNLAQMSGTASQEISTLLTGSVQKVENIVDTTSSVVSSNMDFTKGAVEKGVKIVQECARALQQIVEVSREVTSNVSSISQASQEQSFGVAEVSKALHQIEESTQTALQASQDSKVAAEELAAKLKDLQRASGLLRLTIEGKRAFDRFQWNDKYFTGVDSMDQEHQTLIEKMNNLIDLLGQDESSGKGATLAAYKDLAQYAVKHFQDEEAYFTSIPYPNAEEHKAVHGKLVAKVVELESKIGSPEFDPFEVTMFLKDWLMRHILSMDKNYGPSFVSRNQVKHVA